MDFELEGRRALVTGSSSGIGSGVAEMLAEHGATAIVHGRDERRARAVADGIRAAGGSAEVVLGDLASPAGCAAVADEVTRTLGGVDILVNNAGGVEFDGGKRFAKFGEKTPRESWFGVGWDQWLASYEQNVGSTVRLVQALAPGMADRGWGRIINTASIAAGVGMPDVCHYGANKSAVSNLTVSLAKAMAGTGVTVNTITPGMIRSPALDDLFTWLGEARDWGASFEEVEQHAASELFALSTDFVGRPSDIAGSVCLLCSPHGRYITGANIRIDGGFSSHPN